MSLNSDGESASDKDSHENGVLEVELEEEDEYEEEEQEQEQEQEDEIEVDDGDVSGSSISTQRMDSPGRELSEDDKDKESSCVEERPVGALPQPPKKMEKVGSDSGSILRYNREQLISIRSATEFSMIPEPPKSVVSNTGANTLRHRRQGGHRPQSRRVLTFNTDSVVLDEVENAYKPSHMKKPEIITLSVFVGI